MPGTRNFWVLAEDTDAWYLIGVIGSGPGAFHTMGGHNCPQVVTFY